MQNTILANGKTIRGLANCTSYEELVQIFSPRIIRTEQEKELVQDVIDFLIDLNELNQAQEDYLTLLGNLLGNYEDKYEEPMPDIYGVELLKVLMEERELRQKDLVPIFKTESIVSDILRERRKLTARHIEELAKFFHVSPAVFFPNPS